MTLAQLLYNPDGSNNNTALGAGDWNDARAMEARTLNGGAPQTGAGPAGVPLIQGPNGMQYDVPRRSDGMPDWNPTAIANHLAQRKIATLQNTKGDGITPDDYVNSAPTYGLRGPDLVKAQLANGGTDAFNILGVKSTASSTNFNYSKVNPVTEPDELLANPKFVQLARNDPAKASKLFQSFTGKDFASHIKEEETNRIATVHDYRNKFRDGLMEGKLRVHPTGGWVESKTTIPSMIPNQPPQEIWTPLDETVQMAFRDHAQKATGYMRSDAGYLSHVAKEDIGPFMREYQKQTAAGKSDADAASAAAQALKVLRSPAAQSVPAITATTVKANPERPPVPEDPAEAQAFLTQQAQTDGRSIRDMAIRASNQIGGTIFNAIGKGLDNTMGFIEESGKGLANLPNRLAVMAGKKTPLWDWQTPAPKEPFGPQPVPPWYIDPATGYHKWTKDGPQY